MCVYVPSWWYIKCILHAVSSLWVSNAASYFSERILFKIFLSSCYSFSQHALLKSSEGVNFVCFYPDQRQTERKHNIWNNSLQTLLINQHAESLGLKAAPVTATALGYSISWLCRSHISYFWAFCYSLISSESTTNWKWKKMKLKDFF